MERNCSSQKRILQPFHSPNPLKQYSPGEQFLLFNDQHRNIWKKFTIILQNHKQFIQLKNNTQWRQNTSMPILKAKFFDIEPNQIYPRSCTVLIEHIFVSFSSLSNLQLNHVLYLLNQSLLGFNALRNKFGSVTVSKQNCGINHKGECRVWKGDDQFGRESKEKGMTEISKIAQDLIDIMCEILKPGEEKCLRELKREIEKQQIKTFYLIHWEIKKLAEKYLFTIPSSFPVNSIQQIPERKVSFQYHSPIKSINTHNHSKRVSMFNSYKGIKDSVKGQSILASPQLRRVPKSKNLSLNRLSHLKSFSCLKKVPEEIQEKSTDEVVIQEFSLGTNKIEKQFEMTISPSLSEKKIGDSLSTTLVSQSKIDEKSKNDGSFHNFPEQLSKELKKINDDKEFQGRNVLSLMIESMKVSDVLQGNYDFGGLIHTQIKNQPKQNHEQQNIPDEDLKAEVNNRNAFSLHTSKFKGKEIDKLIYSVYMDENKDKNQDEYGMEIIKKNSWEQKFKGLVEIQGEDLKESITCGQEKQLGVRSDVKLLKLGKMGRQVQQSIIPMQKL